MHFPVYLVQQGEKFISYSLDIQVLENGMSRAILGDEGDQPRPTPTRSTLASTATRPSNATA